MRPCSMGPDVYMHEKTESEIVRMHAFVREREKGGGAGRERKKERDERGRSPSRKRGC